MVDQIAYEINKLYNDSIIINASIRVAVENNAITLYLDITFQSSNVTRDTIIQICNDLKGKLEPVSDKKFENCVIPPGTRYVAGNTVTMSVQSEPNMEDGAMGLTSSFLILGISLILNFLYQNL